MNRPTHETDGQIDRPHRGRIRTTDRNNFAYVGAGGGGRPSGRRPPHERNRTTDHDNLRQVDRVRRADD